MKLKHDGQYVFRTQRSAINPESTQKEKEDKKVRNAEKTIINELAAEILAWARDEERQLAASQPDPPPPCILAKTQTQTEVAKHYESNTIHSAPGLESYAPPPVILVKED